MGLLLFPCLLGAQGQALPEGLALETMRPPRLAVLEIAVKSNEPAARPREALEDLVGAALLQTRRFDLVERPRVDLVIRELRFQREGLVDPDTIQQLGRLLGAEVAVVGSAQIFVGLRAFDIHLTLRMIQVSTGRVSDSLRIVGRGGSFSLERAQADALEDLTNNLDEELSRRYPTRGIVLKTLADGRALVDVGLRDRLKRGSRLQSFRRERILHPVTHQLVEDLSVPICQLVVEELHERTAVVKTKPRNALAPGTPIERIP
jgi:hypothetical protein